MKKGGGLLAIELSPPEKPGRDDEDEVEDEAAEEAKIDAARAILAAIKRGDAEALSSALEEHRAACEAAYAGEEE